VSSQKIAVLFIHGVEIRDPNYAQAAIARLRRQFAKHAGGLPGADEALVIEPAYWIPAVADHEDKILEHTFDRSALPFYRGLDKLVAQVDRGSMAAMVPIALSGLLRRIPGVINMGFPTLRWAMTYFVGDAISYQITEQDRSVYDGIHHRIGAALRSLAKRAGPDAPLCVISHSLGTVIASDHIYDQQQRGATRPATDRTTPVERCETLAFMYTLGSPIPIWTLRYKDFGEPIAFPPPTLDGYYPDIAAEWVNFHDRDDIVAYPLHGLSPAYDRALVDRAVSVGPMFVRRTPLSHLMYWNDDKVMGPIGESLADAWCDLRAAGPGGSSRPESRAAADLVSAARKVV
jgi:hypothetical protein